MTGPPAQKSANAVAPWTLAAALVFALAAAAIFGELSRLDLRESVLANVVLESEYGTGKDAWDSLGISDLRFVSWQITRNARTLLSRPWDFYDGEMCHPAERAMAFGPSGLALGIVAIPGYLLSGGDPVATFTWTTLAITFAAAFGLMLAVRAWTGVAAAGIVAGLLYAFHEVKLGDVIHLYVWDNAWTAWALYFAHRFFTRGGWGSAFALLACVTMQLGGDVYPLVAAAFVGGGYGAVLAWKTRGGAASRGQWALLLIGIGVMALLILGPYLGVHAEGELADQTHQFYRPLPWVLPGGGGFPGWLMLALAAAAFALPRPTAPARDAPPDADPRWPLLTAALLIASFSLLPSDSDLPAIGIERMEVTGNLYVLISQVLPGLAAARSPGAVYTGAHLCLCALAGLGAARVLGRIRKPFALPAAILLIGLAWLDVARPAVLGLTPRVSHHPVALRPEASRIAFYEALAEHGDTGPLLELPLIRINLKRAADFIFMSAYHGRPTAHCYNAFQPKIAPEVAELARVTPDPDSLERLFGMGFRTIIVEHPSSDPYLRQRRARFERFRQGEGGEQIELLAQTPVRSAYRLKSRMGNAQESRATSNR